MPHSSNFSLIPLLTSLAFYTLTLAQEASETIARNPLAETPTQDKQDSEIPGVTAPPEAPVAPGTIGNRNGSPGGDSKAGAKGPDDGSFSLSKGGMIAVIVVVVIVVIVGSESQPRPSRCLQSTRSYKVQDCPLQADGICSLLPKFPFSVFHC